MESTNKKRNAVVAAATAAALLLSGTFAWNMATDQTKLNEFSESDKGNYGVELKENFDPNDPWANKDVYVTNTEDNPVIVRVRLEEFYDLTYRNGTEYNKPEGYANRDADGSAIFTPDAGDTLNDDKTADSATKLNEKISLLFGAGVVTMAEYNAMDANAKAEVKWVVDTDGWCYYTQALLAGETTEYLLDKATFNKDVFDAAYDSPYNLDYRINVRLQAISADLEDFGSHLNDMQWTNVAYIDADGNEVTDNAGRVITEDERADNYEITADSTITDEAMALVTGIAYPFATPYTEGFKNADGSVAKRVSNATELINAMKMTSVHSILLTDNIEITEWTGNPFMLLHPVYGNKMIDLGEYTLTDSTTNSEPLFYLPVGAPKLSIKHGNIALNGNKMLYSSSSGEASSIELVGVNITGATNLTTSIAAGSDIKIYGSDIVTSGHTLTVESNTSILLSSSQVTSLTSGVIIPNGYVEDVNITLESPDTDHKTVITSNGTSGTDNFGIFLQKGWTLNAKDSTIEGFRYGITENYNYTPGDVYLENCTIRSNVGYYKVGDSKLTIKNSEIIAAGLVTEDDPESGYTAAGLVIRSGDVTLDNVNVTTSQGTFPSSDFIWTDDEIKNMYNSEGGTNGPRRANFEAMQIILNNYDSINLNIIGGSYTATYQGHDRYDNPVTMRSIYVQDSTYTIHREGSGYEYPYTYNNTITISGDPTFSPETTVFDQTYTNTTINK